MNRYNVIAILITIIVSILIIVLGIFSYSQYNDKQKVEESTNEEEIIKRDSILYVITTNQQNIKNQLDSILLDEKRLLANSDSVIVLENKISQKQSIIILKQ